MVEHIVSKQELEQQVITLQEKVFKEVQMNRRFTELSKEKES